MPSVAVRYTFLLSTLHVGAGDVLHSCCWVVDIRGLFVGLFSVEALEGL